MIKNVSLSETHACAVDSSGRLFCWGFGPNGELGLENHNNQINIPTIVTKQKQFNIKKAIAYQNYTVFCSGAGYVYLYGTLQP
jgi:alpha-tubulin suppressor-like RCC1 family protein